VIARDRVIGEGTKGKSKNSLLINTDDTDQKKHDHQPQRNRIIGTSGHRDIGTSGHRKNPKPLKHGGKEEAREIAGIAEIARNRRNRKSKTLPLMNADLRGSRTKRSASATLRLPLLLVMVP
jgi:hypothetical protein